MAPTLTPMKTSTSRSFLFGGGRTVVKRKGHRTTAQPRSNETEETKTIVFTEGFTETSPFPNNNDDSGMSSSGGKTPMRREANSRSGGGNKMIQLKRRPAINIKNKRRLDDEEDYELFDLQANKEDNDDYSKEEDSSPGSRAGQSLADDDSSTYSNASEESSDNEWNDDEILQNTDDEDTDDEEEEDDLLDNNNGQWLGMNNNNYDEEDDSSVEEENNQREIWDLKQVLTVKQIYQPGPIKCQTEKCRLIACCIWSSNLDPNTPWYTCLDCQEKDFKGWPAEGELPLKVFPNELRNAMMDRCTKYRKYSSKKRIKPSMPDWLPTGEEEKDEEEEEENISQQFTTKTQYTTQFMDGEDDGGTLSDTDSEAGSVDSEEAKEDQVASMLENVLGSGIASVCRLRKLFPIHFFEKMDFGGTTVTRFDKNVLKAICNDDPYWSEDEDDDDESMVSSFKARTQKSLSPLTEYTQKNRKVAAAARSNVHEHVGYSDQEKRLASEALLILRWTQNEGVGSILREGNLASVIFGISVPSEEDSSSSSGELIESYSFNISYNKPDYPEEVDTEEVMDTTGSFFQNLNGFQAGNRSLSQAVVPCKTQGSQYTQASRGATSQYPTQTQSVDFSIPLSQKHTQTSKSQMLTSMSQSQMMASMSQSIRVSVKKNQGNKIPTSRYLTLRVDFTALLKSKELPQALRQGKSSKKRLIPIAAVQPNAKETKDGFVVTPLGRITENGHSGLCVDMFAETKCSESADKENNDGSDDEDMSDNHSQKSHSSPANSESNKDDDSPLTEKSTKDLSENDVDDKQNFTQHEKDDTSSHDDDEEASPNESASVDGGATATQIVNEQCEAEENTSIQVDAKAFGIPFGLGLDNDTYIQCEIREQRTTQLKDDLEVEEFKCCFDSDELEKAGMKKQWIPKTRLMSYNEMFQNVQFYLQFKESKGDDTTSSSIIEEVAQNVRVDPAFVGMLAKKRKAAQDEREEKMKRVRR